MKQSQLGLISLIALTIIIVTNCSGQLTLEIDATTTPTAENIALFAVEPEPTVVPTLAPSGTFTPDPTGTLSVSPVITATPPVKDVATIVLEQTAELVCPASGPGEPSVPDVSLQDARYGFNCVPAAGHSTGVWIEQFADQHEAQAAFDSTRGDHPVQDFHNFPLSAWQEQHPSFPDGRNEYTVWVWQAGRWLIYVSAFDDTHFEIAPDPQTVSETIYRLAIDHDLFSTGGD
jgi:hypothetical protein